MPNGSQTLTCGMPRDARLVHDLFRYPMFGANMGDVMRLIPTSERGQTCLTRDIFARCSSVFPPTNRAGEQRDESPVSRSVGSANPYSSVRVVLS